MSKLLILLLFLSNLCFSQTCTPFELKPSSPDLLVNKVLTETTDLLKGTDYTFTLKTQNIGIPLNNQSNYTGVFISNNPYFDSSDFYLSDVENNPNLVDSDLKEINLIIPPILPEGDYYLLFVADYKKQVQEIQETNNSYPLPIYLTTIDVFPIDPYKSNVDSLSCDCN